MNRRLNFKINNIIIDEITQTLNNFREKFKEWETMPWYERDDNKNPYKEAAHAMLIVAQKSYGDCLPIDVFIENVESGGFIDNDGSGYFVDTNGNIISSLRCDAEWLRKHTPENAKFIMWFNK